jgi:hypothetical protein
MVGLVLPPLLARIWAKSVSAMALLPPPTTERNQTAHQSHWLQKPFDGDWVYWAQRLMRDPLKPMRVVKLLKQQRGKCDKCGFRSRQRTWWRFITSTVITAITGTLI